MVVAEEKFVVLVHARSGGDLTAVEAKGARHFAIVDLAQDRTFMIPECVANKLALAFGADKVLDAAG